MQFYNLGENILNILVSKLSHKWQDGLPSCEITVWHITPPYFNQWIYWVDCDSILWMSASKRFTVQPGSFPGLHWICFHLPNAGNVPLIPARPAPTNLGFLLFCINSCLTCPTLQCFLQNHNFCVKSNRYNNCSINTSKSVIVLYKGECINGKIMCSYWVLGPQNQYIQHNMPPYKQSVPKKESTKYKISSQAKRHRPSPLFISLTILIYH